MDGRRADPAAGEPGDSGEAVVPGPGLPDLAGIDFADLEAMPDTVLRAALRRVLAEDTGPARFAAFQNSL